MMRSSWIGLCCLMILGSGCSTVKGWLRPMVCDCAEPQAVCPVEHDDDYDPDTAEENDGSELARSGDSEDEEEDDHGHAEDPMDPSVAVSAEALAEHIPELTATLVSTPEEAKAMRKDYLIRGDLLGTLALEGNFARGPENEILVVSLGKSVDVFSDASRVAGVKLDLDVLHPYVAQSGIRSPVVATEVVRDGTFEWVLYGVRKEDTSEVLEVRVMKVIGESIATVFSAPLARNTDKGWVKVGTFSLGKGLRHRFILYTAEGATEPTVYRWNVWEGMYRIPYTPPTAPENQNQVRLQPKAVVSVASLR